ncbi:isoeugenol monooxygenase [Macrophomina phaseolina]|uniref:Isoeugenol monooxygenase n=1 Tax=Macrophomina phaseolina TaxID=35725 RepID=A0ABQ8GMS7_9PEZI|nr:isoeugenol monooxygenase [Macrophomina phaseolina]
MAASTIESTHPEEHPYHQGLASKWPLALDLAGSNQPCRLEGSIADLPVLGTLPPEIEGTFYRVMCDPFVPPHPSNVPIDGDGSISAFRVRGGRVDMRMAYVHTERYLLERRRGARLFGLYRNPFTHHPCVRAAVDSTANTNLVLWAGQLLALKEVALPYAVDPHTLATRRYDPFEGGVAAKTFTAHPKVDGGRGELVVFGYEAKGLGTRDVVVYALDRDGQVREGSVVWLESPWCAFIHDCAVTENWVVLVLWPFEADVERMKEGGQHWAWNYDRPATFVVVPRRTRGVRMPPGWQEGETRTYHWRNCMPIHTGGAWEVVDRDGSTRLCLESSRVHDNAFPFFPSEDGRMPAPDAKADYVRWELDLSKPSDTQIPDPQVILDVPTEFPRIDERFIAKRINIFWADVFLPERSDGGKNIFHGLNALAMHNHETGQTRFYYAGDDSLVQEPVFIPRSDDAVEGDGWVMAMVERRKANRNDLVVIDTREFEKAVAIVQLPLHVKAQIHGNWVDAKDLGEWKSLVDEIPEMKISGKGALEPLI